MRHLIDIMEKYYRGTRDEPEKSARTSLSFTDDKDVASVYAASPVTGNYISGSRVSGAEFEMKNPVDLSNEMQIDLNNAFYAVGISDASEHVDDVLKLINGLSKLHDKGWNFHYKIINNLDWDDLKSAIYKTAQRDDWDSFFNLLDYTFVDTYALCDTPTFIRLAKQNGFDGIIHMDNFDAGVKIADSLLGKKKDNKHLTYRPFGDIKWGL